MPEEESEELFDEDLEEEVLEEDEESEDEIQNLRSSRLNEILANPWTQVSLDQRGEVPVVSLEMNLDPAPIQEDTKEEKINYMPTLESENEKAYQPASMQGEMEDKFISEAEKNLEEQKRLYSNPQTLRPERRQFQDQEKEFISTEDTMKKDYLTKKKFF